MSSILELEDGTKYYGMSFGFDKDVSGEVVFNTSMVGYTENLTDPSYKKQILVLSYPIIGNYGIPNANNDEYNITKNFESNNIQIEGLIVSEYVDDYSHYQSDKSLDTWLMENKVPGLYNIDTRDLILKIRNHGSLLGRIYKETPIPFFNTNAIDLVSMVSTKKHYTINSNPDYKKIIVVDCGIKNSILRKLAKRNLELKVVPSDYNFLDEMINEEFDGLFLSNGPGDPYKNSVLIENVKKLLAHQENKKNPIPIFGICLGHQIISIAIGATIKKMVYGNRSLNQPVKNTLTNKCYITTQNHGYALDESTLPKNWIPYFENLNDNSNEGIINTKLPYFTVQFHPEGNSGPEDTDFLFDKFMENINKYTKTYKKVLILGSGGLMIGQAGEFDYSGSQAIKALKEENIKTVLVNPNIATIQTSQNMADEVYFLPVTSESVEKVIIKENPDGILATFGGQTALNCLVNLDKSGILKTHNVKVMGTPVDTIISTEDRGIFAEKMSEINQPVAPSKAVSNLEDAISFIDEIGFPVIVRSAYALGGLGSGFAENMDEFKKLVNNALENTTQILIDKSLKGWKELEYEVIRDADDNCFTVCNMENFDPLGVHTGDSIVVAPSQTLSNDEYFMLRNASINIIRHLGVVGECNVQYALDPNSKSYYVIEVNARLSRSSALASKATGYPIAYIAAKLSLNQSLSNVKNIINNKSAFYEPSLDYIVVKMPKWDIDKFYGESREIGSSMKSIGEVMAIGRTFEETINKAVRMANQNLDLFQCNKKEYTNLEYLLKNPNIDRIYHIMNAFDHISIEEIKTYTNIDCWFLKKLHNIYSLGNQLKTYNLKTIPKNILHLSKKYGFSDNQLSTILNSSEHELRNLRKNYNIKPLVKKIDSSAGEFPSKTNYLFTTYNAHSNDVEFYNEGVIVLGCGSYKIGNSVEFDWCAVNCLETLQKNGKKSIMINYNPETISTDYNISDRLYFEEITHEKVLDIYEYENPEGVIVSVGGQIPNNIAMELHNSNVNILGTHPKYIDNAEDRSKFSNMLDNLNIDQPEWKILSSIDSAIDFCNTIGYPVIIRPSYVLSGGSMSVINNKDDLRSFIDNIQLSNTYPVVISKFIIDSKEIDIDGVAKNGKLVKYIVSEHIENAGTHSGDATIVLPCQTLSDEILKNIETIVSKITDGLNICGPFNIQMIVNDDCIKIIECNLRASRSFPFVSKTYNINLIEWATKIMLDIDFDSNFEKNIKHVCIKSPMFSFNRLPNTDPILGVDMLSTGEVACFGENIYDSFIKSLMATGFKIPDNNILFSVDNYKNIEYLHECFTTLLELNMNIYATKTTSDYLKKHNIKHIFFKDIVNCSYIDMVVGIPNNTQSFQMFSNGYYNSEEYKLRRKTVNMGISIITNVKLAELVIKCLKYIKNNNITYDSWNNYTC